VHVSGRLDDGSWAVEVRLPDAGGPDLDVTAGERVALPDGLVLRLVEPWPDPSAPRSRLWRASPSRPVEPAAYLPSHGRPVSLRLPRGRSPLRDFQTVFADEPGSAEMASAGRPFTPSSLCAWRCAGGVAPVVPARRGLEPELHEPPLPSASASPRRRPRWSTPRGRRRRVVAVGTT
jgi:S-adenosylmethionine:tRNA ribosyltransferase-isomerase